MTQRKRWTWLIFQVGEMQGRQIFSLGKKVGLVTQACNPSTLEEKPGEAEFRANQLPVKSGDNLRTI